MNETELQLKINNKVNDFKNDLWKLVDQLDQAGGCLDKEAIKVKWDIACQGINISAGYTILKSLVTEILKPDGKYTKPAPASVEIDLDEWDKKREEKYKSWCDGGLTVHELVDNVLHLFDELLSAIRKSQGNGWIVVMGQRDTTFNGSDYHVVNSITGEGVYALSGAKYLEWFTKPKAEAKRDELNGVKKKDDPPEQQGGSNCGCTWPEGDQQDEI